MRIVHAGLVVLVVAAGGWAPRAAAFPNLYTTSCQGCHGAPAATINMCTGCHAHGTHSSSAKNDINLAGALSKTTFAPGETVSVTVTGGYQPAGASLPYWARAVLLDLNAAPGSQQLARSAACPTGPVGPAPCTASAFPFTLTHAAPTAPGTYTWAVAWYGNVNDAGSASFGNSNNATTLTAGSFTPDATNSGHGWQVVSLLPFTVAAASSGPTISVTPASVAFGSVAIGSHLDQTVTISNTGTAALTVTSIARAAGTSTEFSVTPTTLTVNPGASGTVTFTYTPTTAAAATGAIVVTSNDPAHATTTVNVSGTGTTAAAPIASVTPASLDFGAVTVGANSSKTLTISNGGTVNLTVAAALGSGTSGEYTFTPASLTVGASASQTVTVTYAPTDQTTDAGQLVLTTNDPAQPTINVALTGSGTTAASGGGSSSGCSTGAGSATFATLALLAAMAVRRVRRRGARSGAAR